MQVYYMQHNEDILLKNSHSIDVSIYFYIDFDPLMSTFINSILKLIRCAFIRTDIEST